MKPILYLPAETNFNHNGVGVLYDAIKCEVTEERHGIYELEMTYPVSGRHYSEITYGSIIKAIPFDGGDPQLFSVYKITKPISGKVSVYAEHISYRLSHIPCSPFEASGIDAALQGLKSHATEDCPFTFWTNKSVSSTYKQTLPASIRSRLLGVEGSILDTYAGEYEFDNFTVKLHLHRGSDNGVVIRYGVNLTDLTQEESIEDTITGIYPFWQREEYGESGESQGVSYVELPEKTLYSENADNFPYKRSVVMDFSSEFDEKPTVEALRARTNKYITDNKIGVPKVNLTVSFVPLWQTEEYKNVAPLERVKLCDTVTVRFDKLGVNAKAKVLQTKYDVLKERYIEIKIGETKEASLSDTITSIATNEAETVKKEVNTNLAQSITRATELITGAYGGHKLEHKDADGHIYETLWMDTDDINTAVNIVRINKNGIGFSRSGINGPYVDAWTIDGHLNASYIDVGILDALKVTITNLYAGAINYDEERTIVDAIEDLNESVDARIEESAATLSDSVMATRNLAQGLRGDLNPLLQSMSVTPGEGLKMYASGSESAVQILNDRINFLVNNNPEAYITQDGFHFNRGILTQSLSLGNYLWVYQKETQVDPDTQAEKDIHRLRLLVTG